MSKEIEIKIEPNDPQFDENDEDSNSNMEQPASTSNTDHINNFVGIKQEPVIQIKLEPLEDEYQDDSGDMDTENVLMKFEHSLYESNEAIKLPRAKNVNYKEEDSDEEYVPRMKTAKKTHKKLSTFDPNVKRGFKGRSKTKSKDDPTYSEDIMDKIDIVTIDEATRQEEHQDALRTRKHMNYTCDYCALGFVVEEAYQMHLKIHSEEAGDHECDICKVRLKTSEMQYQHRLRHYRRYRCSICHLQQRDKDTVAAHIMRQHMGIAFVCKHCGRDFKRPQYLNRHIKQMHTKPLYLECPVCSRVFHERGWFRCHVRTHNEQVQKNITRKVQCSHCGREFRNKQYLVRHLAVHEDRRPKTCDMCSRSFKNSEVLRVHKRQHHGQNPASSEKLAYSLEEKKLLVQLVRDRPIIEDKEINYKTIEQKTNAWQELSEAFNAASSTSRRSAVQLRRCWKKMKWMRRKHLRDRILKGLPEGSSSDSESYVDEAIPLVDLQFPDIDNSNTVRKNKKKAERSVSKINITEKLEITIELGKKYDVNMALPEQSEANLDRNKQREENFDIIEPRGVKLEPTEQPEINADRSVISEADKKTVDVTYVQNSGTSSLSGKKILGDWNALSARDYALNEARIPRCGANTTCEVCGRILTTPAMLTRHVQRMHTERIKKFQCDYCQKHYFTKAEVRSHIEWTHLQRRKHACACGRVFRSPALLRDHALTRHLNVRQPKDKSCGVCGKMFANQQVLTRHVKGHSGETYPCTECGQKFKTQSYVKVHYKIKHLKMTRAEVKAQSRRKLIMVHSEEPINAKIKVSKKSKDKTEDPLNLDNFEHVDVMPNVKKEVTDPTVPLFETFVDIQREC